MPNFTRLATASVVLTNAMSEFGLTPPASFLDSQDLTVTQLVTMLSLAGQDLAGMTDWQELHKEFTLTGTGVETRFALPEDFNGFVSGAGWDNTKRWPAIGAVPPVIWRLLKARMSNGELSTVAFKLQGGFVVFFSAPQLDEELIFDYYSRGWIRDGTDPTIYRDNIQADTDVILFDSRLITAFLKVRWRAGKEFDTNAAVAEFNEIWDTVTGRDSPGPTLSIGLAHNSDLLGFSNIPDTGYGNP